MVVAVGAHLAAVFQQAVAEIQFGGRLGIGLSGRVGLIIVGSHKQPGIHIAVCFGDLQHIGPPDIPVKFLGGTVVFIPHHVALALILGRGEIVDEQAQRIDHRIHNGIGQGVDAPRHDAPPEIPLAGGGVEHRHPSPAAVVGPDQRGAAARGILGPGIDTGAVLQGDRESHIGKRFSRESPACHTGEQILLKRDGIVGQVIPKIHNAHPPVSGVKLRPQRFRHGGQQQFAALFHIVHQPGTGLGHFVLPVSCGQDHHVIVGIADALGTGQVQGICPDAQVFQRQADIFFIPQAIFPPGAVKHQRPGSGVLCDLQSRRDRFLQQGNGLHRRAPDQPLQCKAVVADENDHRKSHAQAEQRRQFFTISVHEKSSFLKARTQASVRAVSSTGRSRRPCRKFCSPAPFLACTHAAS